MEKKHTHSNKDFGYSVDAIFTMHLTNLSDQIIVLQKALRTSRGDNLLKIATVPNDLDKILQNLKKLSVFNVNVVGMNGCTMKESIPCQVYLLWNDYNGLEF